MESEDLGSDLPLLLTGRLLSKCHNLSKFQLNMSCTNEGVEGRILKLKCTYQNLRVFLSCSPVTIELRILWFLSTGGENSAALGRKTRMKAQNSRNCC